MKNKLLLAGALFLAAYSNAQIAPPETPGSHAVQSEASVFKPGAKDLTFELNFIPFGATPVSLNYLRARWFMSDQIAIRAGISVALRTGSDNKSFEYALLPGIEKHFAGTNRLSPYVGGELAIAGRGSSGTEETGSGATLVTTETKGAWSDGSNRGYFNFGLNGVIGCDFYFSKRIYMGLEAGFGFNLNKSADVTVTSMPNGGTSTTTTSKGGSAFQLGPNYNAAIRIGFVL
jgi:hypothetical protein